MSPANSTFDPVLLRTTKSVCPVCLCRVTAECVAIGDNVYLRKNCPTHGPAQTILWRGVESYLAWGAASATSAAPAPGHSGDSKGCPYECGLCTEHSQKTCCVILEVTNRCNLSCPICFASASPSQAGEPSIERLVARCQKLLARTGPFNVQLSGGEPTVRNDLPALIAELRAAGIPFVQLNSNGLRLSEQSDYARILRQAGLDCVFLQFDGVDDEVFTRIRGKQLIERKLAAIENCARARLGVVLVPTLVPGVNTAHIGSILRFALERVPAVRAVHFQPISYFGRFPQTVLSADTTTGLDAYAFPAPPDSSRITIPEILSQIESQSGGVFHTADFRPPSAEHAHCSFQGRFRVSASGAVEAVAAAASSCCGSSSSLIGPEAIGAASNQSARARQAVARQWAFPAEPDSTSQPSADTASMDTFLAASARTLSISGMAFQDAWNLDLDRLRKCFLHVAAGDGALIPLCAYNLTGVHGRKLYRRAILHTERDAQ